LLLKKIFNTSVLAIHYDTAYLPIVRYIFFWLSTVYSRFLSAWRHIIYAKLAIARPSVCPSHIWVSQKRLKLRKYLANG